MGWYLADRPGYQASAIWSYCELLPTALNWRVFSGPPCVSVGVDERSSAASPSTALNALIVAASALVAACKQVVLPDE